jgi:hypothetical protein
MCQTLACPSTHAFHGLAHLHIFLIRKTSIDQTSIDQTSIDQTSNQEKGREVVAIDFYGLPFSPLGAGSNPNSGVDVDVFPSMPAFPSFPTLFIFESSHAMIGHEIFKSPHNCGDRRCFATSPHRDPPASGTEIIPCW